MTRLLSCVDDHRNGGLQFSPRTWRGFGGTEFARYAYQASREQQIVVAERVLAEQGWGAWPSCSRRIGACGEGVNLRDAPAPSTERVRLSAPAANGPASHGPAATSGNYTVQPGDTLSLIAARHHVAGGWRALVERNPALAADPDQLTVGQQITV